MADKETKADLILQTLESLKTDLTTKSEEAKMAEAHMAEEYAKLSQNLADMAEENTGLKAEVAHLESEEHAQEVVAHWLNSLDMADPEAKARLAEKLDLGMAEVEETVVAEPEEPVEKSELELIGEFLARK